MQLTMTINTDSTAFDGDNRDYEIARILREVAGKVEEGGGNFNEKLRDFNGNICGMLVICDDDN